MKVLYRVPRRDAGQQFGHPLLDGVMLTVHWADLEPRRGAYETSAIRTEVQRWRDAGKQAYLRFAAYSNAEDGKVTPAWALQALGTIPTSEGSIPNVLNPAYRAMLPQILAALSGCGASGLVGGIGHNGGLAACTDRDGSRSWVIKGWSETGWADLCRFVLDTHRAMLMPPPMVTVGHVLLRDGSDHAAALEGVVDMWHAAGSTVITLGLESAREDMPETVERVERLTRGRAGVIIGDDWPLWVPPGPRRKAKPTRGRDDDYFAAALKLASSLGVRGVLLQAPEIAASNPGGPGFVPAVHEALKAFRAGAT